MNSKLALVSAFIVSVLALVGCGPYYGPRPGFYAEDPAYGPMEPGYGYAPMPAPYARPMPQMYQPGYGAPQMTVDPRVGLCAHDGRTAVVTNESSSTVYIEPPKSAGAAPGPTVIPLSPWPAPPVPVVHTDGAQSNFHLLEPGDAIRICFIGESYPKMEWWIALREVTAQPAAGGAVFRPTGRKKVITFTPQAVLPGNDQQGRLQNGQLIN